MLETMRPCLLIGAGAIAALGIIVAALPGLAEPLVTTSPKPMAQGNAVIELFTSQGCSSCPPADKLLTELAERPGVIALSYSVDYWNYLGWHDTLSSPANSERQREYAQARGDGRVYTPQVVVDGLLHANGGDEKAIDEAIVAASVRLADVKVPISMHAEGDSLVIGLGAAPKNSHTRAATVWLAIAREQETVAVTRGENRGLTLSYHHPVRELSPVGMWKGEAMTLRLPLKDLKTMGGDCLVALLQVENAGPILGAAEYEVAASGT
ncbi:MAG TPA: DUF1223 domain-containing protein [Rhizobiales bacterium]|nr:DUF1223 domain-containing protein [Hyphomicrobiales bacterium]HAN63264.1 DUF1223 domain-containing protein [Hyphomicrobiales bacterium]HBH41826.1 DUF1223 domain-containing protein [Hyphomicrobiales bacterium]HCL62084.1 DUF1223 domain-containing protein [Hyphomicrobiales bacterium]